MKKFWILAAAFLASTTALAQFEGVAEFKSTVQTDQGNAVVGNSKVFLTKSAYRAETEMDFSAMIQGRKGGERAGAPASLKMTMISKLADPDHLYLINDRNKTYSVMDLTKMREEMKNKDPKLNETFTVQKLGGDTVAGLSCQKALLTSSKGTQIEVCMTKDISASSQWFSAISRRQSEAVSWMATLKDNGVEGFPVRWKVRPKDSKSGGITMELTRFEKKSFPASVFEVPAGYKQTDSAAAQMNPALERMTPEQRKAFEDAMKRHAQPTPKP